MNILNSISANLYSARTFVAEVIADSPRGQNTLETIGIISENLFYAISNRATEFIVHNPSSGLGRVAVGAAVGGALFAQYLRYFPEATPTQAVVVTGIGAWVYAGAYITARHFASFAEWGRADFRFHDGERANDAFDHAQRIWDELNQENTAIPADLARSFALLPGAIQARRAAIQNRNEAIMIAHDAAQIGAQVPFHLARALAPIPFLPDAARRMAAALGPEPDVTAVRAAERVIHEVNLAIRRLAITFFDQAEAIAVAPSLRQRIADYREDVNFAPAHPTAEVLRARAEAEALIAEHAPERARAEEQALADTLAEMRAHATAPAA